MCLPGCTHVTETRCLGVDFAAYADESAEWAEATLLIMPQLWHGDDS